MAKSGRPPGPIRKYTVEFIWPSDPRTRRGATTPWREAVSKVDEQTARRSATSLRNMRCRFRVHVALVRRGSDQNPGAPLLAGEWDHTGAVVYRHKGEGESIIPAWALGLDPLETPRRSREPKRELSTSGS